MKICPSCRRTYQDDNLNFCLEDGAVLQAASAEAPATVLLNQPRTTGQASMPQTTPFSSGVGPTIQQKKSKSGAWVWILGLVLVLLLLCGGGVGGLLIYLGMKSEEEKNKTATNTNSGTTNRVVNKKTTAPSPSPTTNDTTQTGEENFETIDLNMFVQPVSIYGNTEMSGDELLASSRGESYYYVLVAPNNYAVNNGTVRITVRNVDNANSRLGYGLIFNSDPQPLTEDYGFLIDSKSGKFRLTRHYRDSSNEIQESTLIAWKASPYINKGSAENTLEVRDKGSNLELYINNNLVATYPDKYGFTNGVPGIYTGSGVKVGFKNLQITRP
ncbi:MAG TPA: hypothetical protein VNK26_07970 [Pyrinomonadaceae bacterium]|nr:hypothetical protein [Pyrinomonadaceae bacterium]